MHTCISIHALRPWVNTCVDTRVDAQGEQPVVRSSPVARSCTFERGYYREAFSISYVIKSFTSGILCIGESVYIMLPTYKSRDTIGSACGRCTSRFYVYRASAQSECAEPQTVRRESSVKRLPSLTLTLTLPQVTTPNAPVWSCCPSIPMCHVWSSVKTFHGYL